MAQEATWLSFRKAVSENAQKIRQLPESSHDEALRLFWFDSEHRIMVAPSEFVGDLPSDFDLEAFMTIANVSPYVLPLFTPSLKDDVEWHEEISRLVCYRLLSDQRFCASYLRLGVWNSGYVRAAGPRFAINSIIKEGEYTEESPRFWILTKEVICCAFTTGYRPLLSRELDRKSLVAEIPAFHDYLKTKSFVLNNDLPGWKPAKLGEGTRLGFESDPKIPSSPIADLPACLKPVLGDINAAMD